LQKEKEMLTRAAISGIIDKSCPFKYSADPVKLSMKEGLTMPKITIDGKEYDSDNLSDEAKNQLGSIQFVDRKIQELNMEIAALKTSRNAYARALSEILNKEEVQ
jgi:hypothetical protein